MEDRHDAVEEVLLLWMHQRVELAGVEPGAAAGRAGVDGHAVQVDAMQVAAALGALHPVRLLELLALGRGHLRGVFLGPLLPALDILPREVLVLIATGLFVFGHDADSTSCGPRAAAPARTGSTRRGGRGRRPRGRHPPARATARPAPPTAAPRLRSHCAAPGACSSAAGTGGRRRGRWGIPRTPLSPRASPRRRTAWRALRARSGGGARSSRRWRTRGCAARGRWR